MAMKYKRCSPKTKAALLELEESLKEYKRLLADGNEKVGKALDEIKRARLC